MSRLLLFLALVLSTEYAFAGTVHAATGIRALDETAIPLKSPSTAFLDAITIVGNRLVAVGAHGLIIYSDDNGKSWTQANVPVDVTLTTVAFADLAHGWVAGNSGVVLYTNDAGKTWQLQLTGIQANQLTLTAAQAAAANHSTAVGAPLALTRAKRLISMGPSVPFLSLLVLSSQKVIVFGAYKMTMITYNGGKNWTDCSLSIGDRVSHHLYAAAQIDNDIYVVGEAGLVFRSTDGGNSFPLASNAGTGTLFGVIGTSTGGVLVFGVAGLMYRSGDAGQSWEQIAMPSTANITGVTKLSSGAILALAESGVLYESKDDGKSFAPLFNRLPMEAYAAVQMPDGTIVIVGDHGVLSIHG